MKRNLLLLTPLLAFGALFGAGQDDYLWAGPCANANHKIHFPGFGILSLAVHSPVPFLADDGMGPMPAEPLRYEVTSAPDGVPCVVRLIGPQSNLRLAGKVEAVIRQWQFRTNRHDGQTYCFSSKVVVYAKRTSHGIELTVPGITDRNPMIVPASAGPTRENR